MRGLSIAMDNQILKLAELGYSIRGIAKCLKIARNTVRSRLRTNAEKTSLRKVGWWDNANWEAILKERAKGVTLKQIYIEHGDELTTYSSFCRYLRRNFKKPVSPTIPLQHVAGEKAQIDYCDGIKVVDRKSGKAIKTHLFCGVLPFSGYTFAEFVLNQKLDSFISSHQRMWAYFGGVTPYVVIDNLKAGVTKAHLYDPDINKSYCEYANHDGFAVMPARPYKPRDKAAVESTIGAIQRSFYQEYRDRIFYDLDTLNRVFRDFLKVFNSRMMKDHGVSREERFEVEKPKLSQLPSTRYVIKTWKKSKVHPDSTVQVNHNFYSLPHKHIGEVVNVRISKDLIEIFDDSSESLAVHQKLTGKGNKSISPGHYPDEKIQQTQFDLTKAKAKAQSIGPKMSELIHKMFSSNHPLASLRAVQGMLSCMKLKDIGAQDMEYAASQCLIFNKHRVKFFKGCALQHKVSSKVKKDLSPSRDLDSVYLHHPKIKEDDDDRTSKEAVCKASSNGDHGAFRT